VKAKSEENGKLVEKIDSDRFFLAATDLRLAGGLIPIGWEPCAARPALIMRSRNNRGILGQQEEERETSEGFRFSRRRKPWIESADGAGPGQSQAPGHFFDDCPPWSSRARAFAEL
jgi:hypothetical protein